MMIFFLFNSERYSRVIIFDRSGNNNNNSVSTNTFLYKRIFIHKSFSSENIRITRNRFFFLPLRRDHIRIRFRYNNAD